MQIISPTVFIVLSAPVKFSTKTDDLLQKLQVIQNAPATVAKKAIFDRITPVLRELHWLPFHQHIKFQLAMSLLKCHFKHLNPPKQ